METRLEGETKVYLPHGPLFFASAQSFKDNFKPNADPSDVIIDFKDARVVDHSGIEAIDAIADKYVAAGTVLHLRHLSTECTALLEKSGSLVEANADEDPKYRVADDSLA